ncbi:hypothetical protein BBP40_011285 [Aspergillus hancockii]|nr:hypothetical protein BBP40_011285 [Aspergillus hancockii]
MSVTLTAAVTYLPNTEGPDHSLHSDGGELVKPRLPRSMTVKEGVGKYGEKTQLSCCNKVPFGGDTTVIGCGLSDLLGSGSGSTGVGLASECSSIQVPVGKAFQITSMSLLNSPNAWLM